MALLRDDCCLVFVASCSLLHGARCLPLVVVCCVLPEVVLFEVGSVLCVVCCRGSVVDVRCLLCVACCCLVVLVV